MSGNGIVTLLTDFGLSDSYVAQMKGVVLSRLPHCSLVDITHDIPPQDIAAGARQLRMVVDCFPPETVHVAVVDPGVGTRRAIVAARMADQFFVAPDNGLLSLVVERYGLQAAVVLDQPQWWRDPVSPTFHGRDIMAPVAGHLAAGASMSVMGTAVSALQTLPEIAWTNAVAENTLALMRVVAIDHFGNVILEPQWPGQSALGQSAIGQTDQGRVEIDVMIESTVHSVSLVSTYGQAAAGSAVLLLGSAGELELAVVNGSAAQTFGVKLGQIVSLQRD